MGTENFTGASDQVALQLKLNEAFAKARIKNPQISLRAFSKKLGIHSAALSEFLNGRRRFSKKMAEKIADRLLLSPDEKRALVSNFKSTQRTSGSPFSGLISKKYLQLATDQFRVISDWHHFAILSLAETRDFQGNSEWVASRLRISKVNAKLALARLERLGMLKKIGDSYFPTGKEYATTDEIADVGVKKSHLQDLELSRRSLEEDPVEIRDFTSITMAVDPSRLKEAKKMVRAFRDSLCSFLESGDRTEVYKMSIHLIPLTIQTQSEKNI